MLSLNNMVCVGGVVINASISRSPIDRCLNVWSNNENISITTFEKMRRHFVAAVIVK